MVTGRFIFGLRSSGSEFVAARDAILEEVDPAHWGIERAAIDRLMVAEAPRSKLAG